MTFRHGHAVVITWTLLLLYADAVVVADISGFTAAGWLAVVGLHAALGVPQGAARGRAVGNGAVTVVEDFVLSAVSWITGLRNEALLLLRVSSLRTHPSPPLCLVFTFFSGAFSPGCPWLTYKCGGGRAWFNVAVFGFAY